MPNVALETIAIPGTKLAPTRIALGTRAIGGWVWCGCDDQESIHTIQRALDRGITIIDTATVCGVGHSEGIVGKALAESGWRQSLRFFSQSARAEIHSDSSAARCLSRDTQGTSAVGLGFASGARGHVTDKRVRYANF